MYLFELWFSLDIFPGLGLLDQMVALFLVFLETSILFSIVAAPIYIPTLFSTTYPASMVCRLFDDGHSDLCEVISHCSFDLHFSNNEQC